MGVLIRMVTVLLMAAALPVGVARAEPDERWTGTIDVTQGADRHNGRLTGTLAFAAASDGTITGTGQGDYVDTRASSRVDLEVTGARRGDSVHLVVEFGDHVLESTVPLRGAIAEGPYHALGQDAEYPKGWLRLVCTSCLVDETWTGAVTYGPRPTVGGLTLTVSPEGAVSGSVEQTSEVLDVPTTTKVVVTGSREPDALQILVVASGGDDWSLNADVPIEGSSAHAESSTPPWSVDLTCLNCS